MRCCLEPNRVDNLSGRGIVHIAFGSAPHVLALTSQGEVFAWGNNGYGQLGRTFTVLDFFTFSTFLKIFLITRKITNFPGCAGE